MAPLAPLLSADAAERLAESLLARGTRFTALFGPAPAWRHQWALVLEPSQVGGPPYLIAYSASKGGLLTLTKSLAMAFAGDGVRVKGAAAPAACQNVSPSCSNDSRRSATRVSPRRTSVTVRVAQ